jgi:hypothetical protein
LYGRAEALGKGWQVLDTEQNQAAGTTARIHVAQYVGQALDQVATVADRGQPVYQVVFLELGVVGSQQSVLVQQAVDQLRCAIGSLDAWQQLFVHG